MHRHRLSAVIFALSIATLAACGSTQGVHSHAGSAHTPAPAPAGGAPAVLSSYPVDQLAPGHVTVADVPTSLGPIAIVLHRIRYFGHVSLCVGETSPSGGTEQSCANYPLGPKSNQHIGHAPVWWATTYLAACARQHFQVVSGVLLRRGLTGWLRTPTGVSQMPSAAIPRAFGVAGPLLYANIPASQGDVVTLRDAAGKTVYSAPVEPLTGVPTLQCSTVTSAGAMMTSSSSSEIILNRPGQHEVP